MPSGAHAPSWADWSGAAFARALAVPCPIVLLVETRWSAPCAHLRAHVLADPEVASLLAGHVETIAVDADERPDVAERYTADGWPTLLALTPHGWLLAPVPVSDPRACAGALAHVADQFTARREALLRHVPPEPPPDRVPPGATADADAIVAGWLDDWEGEGGERRAAGVPRALEAAIDRAARDGRDDLVDRAVVLLDHLAASALRHEASGLWFRAAPGAPDGWEPVQALDDQAAWVAAEAAAQAARPTDARAARLGRLVRGIDGALALRHGYRAARFALAAADAATRRDFVELCQHDDRQFVDAQARMAGAMMRAGGAGRMGAWTSRAVDRLDELVATAYRRDGGVAHVIDGAPRLRGLLGDQVAVAAALLDAWDVSGRSAYLDAADELLQSTLRKFRDPATGTLRDRVPTAAGAGDVGLLGRPLHPAEANAIAATCLARIAIAREDDARADAARDLLAACLAAADPADPAHPSLLTALA